jgi:large subunit ribosomal protein L15
MLTRSQLKTRTPHRKGKRVGRGTGSGRGTYAGRGLKGQKSRTGGRYKGGHAGKRFPKFIQALPKYAGFRSPYPHFSVVNLTQLHRAFQEGETVTLQALVKRGLVDTTRNGVKILGSGALSHKLMVEAHAFSKSAEDAIVKAGGSVKKIVLPRNIPHAKKNP